MTTPPFILLIRIFPSRGKRYKQSENKKDRATGRQRDGRGEVQGERRRWVERKKYRVKKREKEQQGDRERSESRERSGGKGSGKEEVE
jgi:hypothetical protein